MVQKAEKPADGGVAAGIPTPDSDQILPRIHCCFCIPARCGVIVITMLLFFHLIFKF